MRHKHTPQRAIAGSGAGFITTMALATLLLASATAAQAEEDTAPAEASTPSWRERALREATGPMRWIRIAAELPTRKADDTRRSTPTAAPAPTPAKRAAAPAPTPAKRAATPADTVRPTELASLAPLPATAARASTETSRPPAETRPAALVVIDEAAPEWDEDLLRTLSKGRVLARFNVAEDGYLSRIQIVESTSPRLTGPVMAALMQWRFQAIPEPQTATVEFGFGSDKDKNKDPDTR